MSQSAVILPGSPLAGSAMVGDINAAWAAIISKFSGSVAPTLGPGAAGALVVGQWWLDTSVTPNVARLYDGTSWCPMFSIDSTNHLIDQPSTWRNLLSDNGSFEVWQRGAGGSASFSVSASTTQYTADRWYITTGANQASTVAQVAGLAAGFTNQSGNACKVTRNSAQTGTGVYTFGFPLDTDEITRMKGLKVTISCLAKSGANFSPTNGTLNLDFYVGTGAVAKRGAGFSSETHVASATANLGTSTQATLSAVSTVVVPANATQGEVQFTWTPVGTAGADDSVTLDDVQLECGVFQSTYERAPFEKMLLSCKRHYWKTFIYGTAPAQNVGAGTGEYQAAAGKTTLGGIFVRNPVSMRGATPSIVAYNPSAANAQIRDETAGADTTGTTISNSTTEGFQVVATGSIGAAGNILGVHLSVDAGI